MVIGCGLWVVGYWLLVIISAGNAADTVAGR